MSKFQEKAYRRKKNAKRSGFSRGPVKIRVPGFVVEKPQTESGDHKPLTGLENLKPGVLKRCVGRVISGSVGSFPPPCPGIVSRQTAGHVFGDQSLQAPPQRRPWTLDDKGNKVIVDGPWMWAWEEVPLEEVI
jgi:hypothetical protein